MRLRTPLAATAAALCLTASVAAQDLYAVKAPRVETGTGETLHHAVMLIEDGKIVTIGEDLVIDPGIPVIELEDNQWVTPGIVLPYTRIGLSGRGYSDSRPYLKASIEVFADSGIWGLMRSAGVVAAGIPPAGTGIPGQAALVRPMGSSTEDLILNDSVYLKVSMRSSSTSKRYLQDGFQKADEWEEKEAKNKEKFDKDKEKAEKEKDKDKKKAALEKLGEYKPIDEDPRAQAFRDLRAGELKMLVSVDRAGTYLHFLDALDEEDVEWDLRMPLGSESDYFHVMDRLEGVRVVMEPQITLHPGTLRQRNLPGEVAGNGGKLVFVPRSDSIGSVRNLFKDIGAIVAAGLDRGTAIRAISLEPAALLGIDETHGSLETGKAADFLIFDGDPMEPGTELQTVVMSGDIVFEEDSE